MVGIKGLRAAAMLMVFLFHAHNIMGSAEMQRAMPWIYNIGAAGTNLFLVISGCFVYASLLTPSHRGYVEHCWRRLFRIYPAYCSMVVMYYAVKFVLGIDSPSLPHDLTGWEQVARNLLLVNVWFRETPVVESTWAVQYIFAYYLVVPWIALVSAKLPPKPRIAWLAVMIWLVLIGGAIGLPAPPRLALLPTGALVWECRKSPLLGMGAGIVPAVAYWMTTAETSWTQAIALWVPPALLYLVMREKRIAGALSHPWMEWLGDRSYSMYLSQGAALVALKMCLPRGSTFWPAEAQVLAGLAANLLLALILYRCIERPGRGWGIESAARTPDSYPKPTASQVTTTC